MLISACRMWRRRRPARTGVAAALVVTVACGGKTDAAPLSQQKPARMERLLDHPSKLTFSTSGTAPLAGAREPASYQWSGPDIESAWHRTKDGDHVILRSPRLSLPDLGDIESIYIRFAGLHNLTRFSLLWSDQPVVTRTDLLQRRRELEVSGSPPSKEFLILGDDLSDFKFPGDRATANAFTFLFLRLPDRTGAVLDRVEIHLVSGLLAAKTSGRLRYSRRGEVRDALGIRAPGTASYDVNLAGKADLLFGIRSLHPGAKLHFRVLLEAGRPQIAQNIFEARVTSGDRWQDYRVSLRGAGEPSRITLIAESSAGDDLVLWSNPILVFDPPARRRPNVVLYVVDALRADHLGYAGYGRQTSPFLDRMAASGTVFRRGYAQAPWTKPSAATLLTSLYPQTHGVGAHASTDILPSGSFTLQESMRQHGYVTAQFSANPLSSTLSNLDQGFDYVFTPTFFAHSEAGAKIHSDDMNEAILPWIDTHARDPFFVYIQSIDPHQPYSAPDGPAHLASQGAATAAYDAEIHFNDRQIGRLYERLIQLGLAEDTLFVVTADHGEAFYEHQHQGHGQSVYEEEVRVPLLMLQPGVVPRRIVDQPVQLVDVMPTILKHCSIPFRTGVLQGQDLFGETRNQPRPVYLSRYFYPEGGETAEFSSDEYTSVIETPWKLIVTRRGGSSRPELELYHLDNDAGERSNIASLEPDVVARLHDHLSGFLRRQEKEKVAFRDALGIHRAANPLIPQDALDRLRSLGYLK